jgi:UDP-N-acetylmuramyl pentapeptide synthase
MSARFTVGEAAWIAGAQIVEGSPSLALEGVFTDSRKPVKGALFVALVGEKFDGSQFAAQAAKDGAAAVLVPGGTASRVAEQMRGMEAALLAAPDTGRSLGAMAHAWRERFPELRVVAVTGSTGKTSTKELIAAVLETAGRTLKTEGNLNNEIGVPFTLLRLSAGDEYAVVECGMNHLGAIARLVGWSDPDAASSPTQTPSISRAADRSTASRTRRARCSTGCASRRPRSPTPTTRGSFCRRASPGGGSSPSARTNPPTSGW